MRDGTEVVQLAAYYLYSQLNIVALFSHPRMLGVLLNPTVYAPVPRYKIKRKLLNLCSW
jgi:hypothetical protein